MTMPWDDGGRGDSRDPLIQRRLRQMRRNKERMARVILPLGVLPAVQALAERVDAGHTWVFNGRRYLTYRGWRQLFTAVRRARRAARGGKRSGGVVR